MLKPANPEYLIQAAYSAGRFDRSDEALAFTRCAIELDPHNASAEWEARGEIEYFGDSLPELKRMSTSPWN